MSRPALPHGPLREEFPDVFVVTGGFRMGPGVMITRNMTVLRQGSDLLVVNSVRLTEEGERALDALGTVRHVIRLGAGHGADDAYYAQRYTAPVWALEGTRHAPAITDRRHLSATDHPLRGGTVFAFAHAKYPEAALLLEREGGILVTCDSYQHWSSFEGCSLMAKVVARVAGFGPTVIGPMWLKTMGRDVARDFEQLGTLAFRHLIPGHGSPLRDTAREGLVTAVTKAKLDAKV